MTLSAGARLGPYEILAPLGSGGMGEVYRARHRKLEREVAIKILPAALAADRSRLTRFEREARTASSLNHPNIVTIHDIDEWEGTTYIAMELVEGRTLRDLIAERSLTLDQALHIATQIADALARAHAAGIIHRDIKPANVMVTSDGLAKLLDFGLAKPLTTSAGAEITGRTLTTETGDGMIVGTPHYMAPEQLSGDAIDHRADQFAFGILLYELVGGRPPFEGASIGAVITAILVQRTPSLRRLCPDVPAELERVICRCLEKNPADRFVSSGDLANAIHEIEEQRRLAPYTLGARLRRPAVLATLAILLVVLVGAAWYWNRGAERRWAEQDALEEITALIETGDLYEAYRVARVAERHRPDDPELRGLLERITLPIVVRTEPAGAAVEVKGYATPDAPWERLGATPIETRVPYAMMRWRITHAGYEPFEGAPFSGPAFGVLREGVVLDTVGTRPSGTVRVPGGRLSALPAIWRSEGIPSLQVPTFFLDRYEVTNRQFRDFVHRGGYRTPELWPDSIVRDGRVIGWEQAIEHFTDASGQPGPATWELGRYPAGQDDYPVGGISWFEAAAYCTSVGKSLPTIYHWFRALGQEQLSDILQHSNIDGKAKAPVGQYRGLGAYGTYDMAGNVKEWARNASGSMRYILGGAWNEPNYMFKHLVAADPWDREPTMGVRCASYPSPPTTELTAMVTPQVAYPLPEPVSDEAFETIRGLYAYDRSPLEARVEHVNDSLADYRRETISFRTAYDAGRMEIHLFIPRDVSPPYQSVIWFPGDDVFMLRSSEGFSSSYLVDFIPRSGRVLVHPVYKGMYERFEPWDRTPAQWRDRMIRWSQDIGRTIDYLETRRDIDRSRIGFYGFSAGALYAPIFSAVEPRLATIIMLGGGFIPDPLRAEAHPATFAPRARASALMINGADDFIMPYELAQRPFFTMLGASPERKRHARLPGGHIPNNRLDIVREVVDWLDLQFGPVARPTTLARVNR